MAKERWEAGVMVKGRNEPCMIERVAAIVAAIKGVGVDDVCGAAWANSVRVFGLGEAEGRRGGEAEKRQNGSKWGEAICKERKQRWTAETGSSGGLRA